MEALETEATPGDRSYHSTATWERTSIEVGSEAHLPVGSLCWQDPQHGLGHGQGPRKRMDWPVGWYQIQDPQNPLFGLAKPPSTRIHSGSMGRGRCSRSLEQNEGGGSQPPQDPTGLGDPEVVLQTLWFPQDRRLWAPRGEEEDPPRGRGGHGGTPPEESHSSHQGSDLDFRRSGRWTWAHSGKGPVQLSYWTSTSVGWWDSRWPVVLDSTTYNTPYQRPTSSMGAPSNSKHGRRRQSQPSDPRRVRYPC